MTETETVCNIIENEMASDIKSANDFENCIEIPQDNEQSEVGVSEVKF